MICFFDRITDYSDDNGRIRINDITMLFCSYVLFAEQYDIILLDHRIKIIKYGLTYRSDIVDRSVHPAICADRSELHSNSRPSGGTPGILLEKGGIHPEQRAGFPVLSQDIKPELILKVQRRVGL